MSFSWRNTLTVILMAGTVVAGFFAYSPFRESFPPDDFGNACPPYNKNQPQLNRCHIERAGELAATRGIAVAFQYARDVVAEDTNYITMHHVMHRIGREAYARTENIGNAFAYLPEDALSPENLVYFDGYQHGVLQAFFNDHRGNMEFLSLVKNACSGEKAAPDYRPSTEDAGDNCFHGIGHALMFVNRNDVFASLTQCEMLERLAEQYWCEIGVFMENSYLYNPLYDPEASRPFVKDDAMISLCDSLEKEEQAAVCARYIGRAHWAAHYGDVAGSLAACQRADHPHRRGCIMLLARFSLTAFFRNDYQKMAAMCRSTGEYYEESCIVAVASGIARGATGHADQRNVFCGLVPVSSQESCRKARW